MAKYRVVQKGSLVMVKSRLSRKDIINESEIEYLTRNYTQGLFRISFDGKRTIEYTVPAAITLKNYLKGNVLEESIFWSIIVQIIETVHKTEIIGLHPGNLWMNTDAMFINEITTEVYCIYQPLSNIVISGNAFSIINDITYAELKKYKGVQVKYLEDFRDFLCSENSYRLENIERYIGNVYPDIFKIVGPADRGKSGFLTTDRTSYREHYLQKSERIQKEEVGGTVCLIEDDENGGTVCLEEVCEDEQTTILSVDDDTDYEDDGATTVLAVQETRVATLIHVKGGVRKKIATEIFSIGKSNINSYCITGNSAVSRKHAIIINRDDDFYLQDCKSTNGTFLNDNKLSEEEEVLLEDGDKIMLADEEFKIEIRWE